MTTSLAGCGAEVRGGLEGVERGSRGVDRMTTSLARCGAERGSRVGLEGIGAEVRDARQTHRRCRPIQCWEQFNPCGIVPLATKPVELGAQRLTFPWAPL
eukprot:1190419-Prorocentrum_minimum.AAC.2